MCKIRGSTYENENEKWPKKVATKNEEGSGTNETNGGREGGGVWKGRQRRVDGGVGKETCVFINKQIERKESSVNLI